MAYTFSMYDQAREHLLEGGTDWQNVNMRASFHTTDTFVAGESTWSDVSGTEISDTGYLPVDISAVTIVVDSVTKVLTLSCDQIDWGAARTWTNAKHMVLRDLNNDRLFFFVNLDTPTNPTNGTVVFNPDVTYGLARLGLNNGYS
jgi:hypothetical protein